eukprot:7451689-Pyramimonas_sp.AAC.1
MLQSGGVRVILPSQAAKIRRHCPDRIISSRMVRRWKPAEGTFVVPEAKSRWCVHGHKDLGPGFLAVCAPTPQTSSIMMFIQVLVNVWMFGDTAD